MAWTICKQRGGRKGSSWVWRCTHLEGAEAGGLAHKDTGNPEISLRRNSKERGRVRDTEKSTVPKGKKESGAVTPY